MLSRNQQNMYVIFINVNKNIIIQYRQKRKHFPNVGNVTRGFLMFFLYNFMDEHFYK